MYAVMANKAFGKVALQDYLEDEKWTILFFIQNNIGRDVDEILRVLQALQSGGLCPVNWRPGQATL